MTTTSLPSGVVTVTTPVDTANTKGDWEELLTVPSNQHAKALLVYLLETDVMNEDYLVDIGVGDPGSEVVRLSNLLYSSATELNLTAVLLYGGQIAAGSRVAARIQCSSSVTETLLVSATAILGDYQAIRVWGDVHTLGANTGDSGGTPVTPDSGAPTTWVEITSSTPDDFIGFFVMIGKARDASLADSRFVFEIGIGAPASETVLVPDQIGVTDGSEEIEPRVLGFIPVEVPSGSRLSIRAGSSLVSPEPIDFVIYGVTEGADLDPPTIGGADGLGLKGGWDHYAWGASAWGSELVANEGVASDFDIAAADPTLTDQFIIIAYPYDPVTAQVETQRWQQVGPDVELTNPYPAKVAEAINFQITGFDGEIATGGAFPPNRGGIRVDVKLSEGEQEFYERMVWRDRVVEVYTGRPGLAETSWKLIASQKARGIVIDSTGFTIQFKQPFLALQDPMQSSVYAGTGGIEGDERLTDRRRPTCFGPADNVEGELIDTVNNVYQLHGGFPIRAIRASKDQGIALESAGNVADVWAWTPVGGFYVTDLDNGLGRLGAVPNGTVTWDVDGHVSPNFGYVAIHSEIVKAMAVDFAGVPIASVDGGSFIRMAANNQGRASYFSKGSESTAQAMSEMLPDVLGFWTGNMLGQLYVGQVLRGGPIKYTVKEHQIVARPTSSPSPFPRSAITLEYARSYRVQSPDNLAGGVTQEVKDFVTQEYRSVRNDSVADPESGGNEWVRQTHFADVSGASTELARESALFAEDYRIWNFTIREHFLQTMPGDLVVIEYPRWRFGATRVGIVLGVTERSGGAEPTTTLTWWG